MVHAVVLAAVGVGATSAQPAFEVASVKPSDPARRAGKSGITTDLGRLTARRVTLRELIFEAHDLRYYQVAGGPSWLGTDEYDIDAKAGGASTPEELRLMLRTLLADRFKLAVHSTTREMKVYALVAGKDGAKIHPVKEATRRRCARPSPASSTSAAI
jgi:uncharacterized protein (TIGR03435 family)